MKDHNDGIFSGNIPKRDDDMLNDAEMIRPAQLTKTNFTGTNPQSLEEKAGKNTDYIGKRGWTTPICTSLWIWYDMKDLE